MKLRSKVVLLIGSLFAVLGAAQLMVQQTILLPGFAQLERDDAAIDMNRVVHTVDRELELFEAMTADWGNWDATYQYMVDHNPEFIRKNMTLSTIQGYRANAVAYVDLKGHFVWSTAIELPSGKPLDIDVIRRGTLPADGVWQYALRDGRAVHGLISTSRGPMLAAFAPVLNGDGKGPHRGMVLLLRLLDRAEVSRIGEQAQVQLDMSAARVGDQVPKAFLPSTGRSAGNFVVRKNTSEVYHVFADATGAPLMTLRITVPRLITAGADKLVNYASWSLAATAIAVVAVLIMVLNRWVLSPLTHMMKHAHAIGRSDDLTARLDLDRLDELGSLANEFDHMVDRLAATRRQLVDQSFDAGAAENASGVLHNLGNAMTPLGVSIAGLQQSLKAAPTADIELVLSELEQVVDDPQRHADLESFLRLTSRELAVQITHAQQELDKAARQTIAIQNVLADQSGRMRPEEVIETVRAVDLIHESCELVAGSLKQSLDIELDHTLQEFGAVRVARTKVQQVFQNLIVNAAQAVRGAGRERGRLRIALQVVPGSGGTMLEWRFTDDGTGIETGNLGRIFDKGFSTKPSHSNSGIGLHWCANTIHALGGTIRAVSAGAGHGASIYVTLPLHAPDSSVARVA
jgi:sensor domain CHASE-containing protein/anti-sigma regulatory factor (Ser/Thr protein kinase)